jgi:predicted RND superfamily exporter protein
LKQIIIKFIEKHARNLVCFLTLFIFLFALGIPKIELDSDQKSWFRPGDALLENYEQFKKEYGSDSTLIILLKFNDDTFKERNLLSLYKFTENLWEIPNITKVDSLSNYSHISGFKDEILIEPFIKDPINDKWDATYLSYKRREIKKIKPVQNYLISSDLKTAAVYVTLRNIPGSEAKVAKMVMKNIKDVLSPKYKNAQIMFTGIASLSTAFEKETKSDMFLIFPIAFSILVLVLFLFLRNIFATIISLGLIGITLISLLGIQGWLGIKMGLVTVMCPLIILAICIVDIVHIFSGYLDSLEKESTTPLQDTMKKNLLPTFLTSTTTMIGFISFIPADILPISNMGILASIGIGLAWIYTIFLICPILYIVPLNPNLLISKVKIDFNFNKHFNFIKNNPLKIVLFFSFLSLCSIFISSKNVINSNMQNYFSKGTDFRQATNFFKENIGGTDNVEIILESGIPEGVKNPKFLKTADLLIQEIKKIDGVTKVNSLTEQIKEVNQVLNGGDQREYIIPTSAAKISQEIFFLEMSLPPNKSISTLMSKDQSDLRLSILWHRSDSIQINNGVKEIESLLNKYNIKGHVTGMAPLISGLDAYIISSFIESMLIATVLIVLFMSFVFRSFFFGVLCLIPNIIVPSFGAAVLYLTDKPFDAGSVLIFSICLGIAIDDTIYFITNLQAATKDHNDIESALESVIGHTGKVLGLTTSILIIIFGLFYLGSFIPNQNFALATTVILGFALIIDLTFLPALILTLNKVAFLRKRLSLIFVNEPV